jgi:hypothetical protein
VYGAQYLDFAEKYFGVGYDADARRCYREARRLTPARALRFGPLRRALGLHVGRSRYERVKRWVRRLGRA